MWGGDADAPTATLNMVPQHAGNLQLTGRYGYGDPEDHLFASTDPLSVDVTGIPAPLTLASLTAKPIPGGVVTLEVGMPRSFGPDDVNHNVPVRLLADGVATGDTGMLYSFETTTRFSVMPTHSGSITYTVVTDGDGGDYLAAQASTTVQVGGIATQPLRISNLGAVRAGLPFDVGVFVAANGFGGVIGAPTGRVDVTVTPPAGAEISCHFDLPDRSCTIPAGMTTVGDDQTITARYLGDSVYLPASATGSVDVFSVDTRVVATFSPEVSRWVVGAPATATWTTEAPSLIGDEGGQVNVTVNSEQVCSEAASVGTCSFTVPSVGAPPVGTPPDTVVRTTFIPHDAALRSSSYEAYGSPARRCFSVSSDTVVTGKPGDYPAPTVTANSVGEECSVPGIPNGFRAGATIITTFAADAAPTNYALQKFTLSLGDTEPVDVEPFGSSGSFTLSANAHITAVLGWGPSCVVVKLTTEQAALHMFRSVNGQPPYDPGHLTTATSPNCASPDGVPTALELAYLAAGYGLYVPGTVVDLQVVSTDTRYDLADVPGAVETDMPGHFAYTVVPAADGPLSWDDIWLPDSPVRQVRVDHQVYGQFRLNASVCRPLRLYAGHGGSLRVVDAAVGELNMNLFEDTGTGLCTTEDDRHGFRIGTTVKLQATPLNNGTAAPAPKASEWFVNRWVDEAAVEPLTRGAALAPTTQGVRPEPSAYRPVSHSVVIGEGEDTTVGVNFAHIDCVNVDVALEYPLYPQATTYGNNGWFGTEASSQLDTPTNCPAVGVTSQISSPAWERGSHDQMPDTASKTIVETRHVPYLMGTKVSASAPATLRVLTTAYPEESDNRSRRVQLNRTLTWDATNGGASIGTDLDAIPTTEVTAVTKLKFTGRYLGPDCRTPLVTVRPVQFGYTVNSGVCKAGLTGSPTSSLTAENHSPLVPVWSMPGSPVMAAVQNLNGFPVVSNVVTLNQFNYHDAPAGSASRLVRLDYCAKIPLAVQVVNASGEVVNAGRETSASGYYFASGNSSLWMPGLDSLILEGRSAADGSCPVKRMALPGESMSLKLDPQWERNWVVLGWSVDGVVTTDDPTAEVSATTGHATHSYGLLITPRCYQLTANSRTSVNTPSNCPGAPSGENWYVPGSYVSLGFKNASHTFGGWTGVDGPADSEGNYVYMNADRVVFSAHNPDAADKANAVLNSAANFVSSITQRGIALLVTAATGVLMAFISVVQKAVTVTNLVVAGLEYIGVPASILDPIKNAAAAVKAGLDAVQSLADCTKSWATGGAAPPFSMDAYDKTPVKAVTNFGLKKLAGTSPDAAQAAAGLQNAKSLLDAGLLFATGVEAYSADARDSWSSAAGIASCVTDKALLAADAAQKAVGR